jgi:hypothetical protein
MRKAVGLVVAVAAISGCSSWEYHKPGVTAAEVANDSTACRRTTTEVSLVSIPTISGDVSVTVPSERIDREAFNRCMADRGYTVRGQ